jgi:hypothetical protein
MAKKGTKKVTGAKKGASSHTNMAAVPNAPRMAHKGK